MQKISKFVFWCTLCLYLITLCTVSYVGVYLTYIAIPLLVLSGLVMKYTNPNSKSTKNINFEKSTLTHVGTVMNEALDGVNIVLNDFNKDLADYNKINFLVKDRAKQYKDQVQKLKIEKIPLEIKLKYAKSSDEKNDIDFKIDKLNKEIELNEEQIEKIRYECELEVKVGRQQE